MKIGDGVDHWFCGRHSGIPDCCIHFFVGPWREIYNDAPRHDEYWKRMEKASPGAGYVLCPECIVDNRTIQIKKCECGE
jgi:hypothetical protein